MKKRILSLLLVLTLLLSLCACGDSVSSKNKNKLNVAEGSGMVIILGNHANANRCPEERINELCDALGNCVDIWENDGDYFAQMNIAVMVCDSDPSKVKIQESYEDKVLNEVITEDVDLDVEAPSEKRIKQDVKDMVESVENFLLNNAPKADHEGVDIPAALKEAVRILNNMDDLTEKHIYLYDSGIVTHGPMAMGSAEDGLFDVQIGTAEEVLRTLPQSALVDLEGVTIHYYGLGDVCYGQKDMRKCTAEDKDFEERMEAIWKGYFEMCGAKVQGEINYAEKAEDDSRALIYDAEEENSLPYVPNVLFYEVKTEEPPEETTEPTIPTEEITFRDAELGGFKPDSGELKNEAMARDTLDSYCGDMLSYVAEHPEITLYVAGFRSVGKDGAQHTSSPKISGARALTVSKLIQEMYGIPASQIVEMDGGTQNIRDVSDEMPEEYPDGYPGRRDENACALNRMVVLIPQTGEGGKCQKMIDALIDAGLKDIAP